MMPVSDVTVQITVRVPATLGAWLAGHAQARGVGLATVARELLVEAWLDSTLPEEGGD
jgi:hypothetical protein